ncbi:PadR family transcriptional regulator [Shewanella khirikhana]|uniref:Lineage-specific thermal regulator protein n=1 Tax=Shewanella khirikhana TaxID=1965282 RepID=A0ABN5TZE1_9GAMM|nr:PadR family transcriptional regulator [Shewanella khirikhana]AZQ12799.1 lineage-specific thermal regulator protein [Shewanella khirikhana]
MTNKVIEDNQTEKWDIQLRKGTLELVVLGALYGGERYGLELLKLLHSYETMRITEGTLYPLLDRLKRELLIDAHWRQEGDSRPRKYFCLTTLGEQRLLELRSRWLKSVEDISALLEKSLNGCEKGTSHD